MKILLTGSSGFIGFHTAKRLLERGDIVIGIDNMNNYYDVQLKKDRLAQIKDHPNFSFYEVDISNRTEMESVFKETKPDRVINLAAQAGVRYSLINPYTYIESNLVGFINILECCRHNDIEHLVYASSSSVYGSNEKLPFSVDDNVDHPVSLYAATKKSNELMAHTYSHLYGLPTTGLRFFTVYGPWGRPDMALFLFTKSIIDNKTIDVYNYGKMQRDFTYIDDIVEGVIRVLDKVPQQNPNWDPNTSSTGSSKAPYKVYNIGNNKPVDLMYFIETIEKCLGKEAKKNLLPLQPGDVPATFADVDALINDVGFKPDTPIELGVSRFINWYKDYYKAVCYD
jgi:UDP-glucuronate 4-epimerase